VAAKASTLEFPGVGVVGTVVGEAQAKVARKTALTALKTRKRLENISPP
jgi:hypothetical protein